MPILEAVSKSVAVLVLVLYVCGYLVTSIYQSKYGFTEVSALRPRIVSAGAWFFLFILIPFAIVNSVLKQKFKWQAEDSWWARFTSMLGLYYFACQSLALFFSWFFDFPYDSTPAPTTAAGIVRVCVKAILFFSLLFAANYKHLPKTVSFVAMIIFVGYFLLWSSLSDLFVPNTFNINSIWLWFFVMGALLATEMRGRAWKLRLGDWPQSVLYLLGALFVFGHFYYPHIKSSLGGGTPTPVFICFTKESGLAPNNVSAYLIDETDAGLYLVGSGGARATFVPRSMVGLVYFSDSPSGSFVTKAK